MTHCTACQKEISGGADTFGEIHLPMCQECWLAFSDDRSEALPIPYTLLIDNEEDVLKLPQYPPGGWFAIGETRA